MYIKEISPEANEGRGLKVTPKLIEKVVNEIVERMTGVKVGGPFEEPLSEIILNQHTAIELEMTEDDEDHVSLN